MLVAPLMIVVVGMMVLAADAQRFYSCKGKLYTYPFRECTYPNVNNGNVNSQQTYYSCNGLLFTYKNPACVYPAGNPGSGGVVVMPVTSRPTIPPTVPAATVPPPIDPLAVDP
ncbi:hypothetical protein BV898_16426 [Hypsibius exemplaris]|uniref:Chitin-binding type-2 domain-containing protein n=1 Tax=Hypsibius exemplaris TaxID=2072580 RepID=A0A9X6NFV3_HYPEX|nr:hypothetical protein BV898_16426 [Hypsibius exemplaris]